MFGSAIIIIDFELIDFVKLYLDKKQVECKVDLTINLKLKSNCRSHKIENLTLSRINYISKIKNPLIHPNMIKSILQPLQTLFNFHPPKLKSNICTLFSIILDLTCTILSLRI